MTYVSLSVVFLVIAAAVLALALAVSHDRRGLVHRWWLPAVCSALALVVLTAVFDNVMIATGLMVYEPDHLAGVLIGAAPIEDFAYPVAGLLLLPAVWLLLGRRFQRGAGVDE
ncbi:MAG TPA: lycopene cyclase domain-containing protein [Mycetocola sp.]|jgi:lycopene cyclase domain-containing protein|uniref:lycopene cyclase domain-containing protein n=1 Tax=Mycetocola sp. TaxID=1871042 RepID=UPI0026378621|nr:lycopene cyclase domain-containing protein [Mycetocola sp.]MCU1560247.1 lctB [Mycetocola sp.]HEV7849034.1 lycopene cyclase domain-containing protein [Mycetocola sp.]